MEESRFVSPAFAASASAHLIELCLAGLPRFFEIPTGRNPWFSLTVLSSRLPLSGTANAEIFGDLDKEISTFE